MVCWSNEKAILIQLNYYYELVDQTLSTLVKFKGVPLNCCGSKVSVEQVQNTLLFLCSLFRTFTDVSPFKPCCHSWHCCNTIYPCHQVFSHSLHPLTPITHLFVGATGYNFKSITGLFKPCSWPCDDGNDREVRLWGTRANGGVQEKWRNKCSIEKQRIQQ